eukprot:3215913-Pyramimonas_sp.AAC.1
MDESHAHRSCFDSIHKLQTIISKAKDEANIEYVFIAFADAFDNNMLTSLGLRELQGYASGQMGKGLVDDVLYKKSMLTWMRQE